MTERPPWIDELIEAISEGVAARLRPGKPAGALLTAAELAGVLGVTEEWVRRNADDLGVRRLGRGPRPRLRFDDPTVKHLAACSVPRGSSEGDSPAQTAQKRPHPIRRSGTRVDLLPIRHPNNAESRPSAINPARSKGDIDETRRSA